MKRPVMVIAGAAVLASVLLALMRLAREEPLRPEPAEEAISQPVQPAEVPKEVTPPLQAVPPEPAATPPETDVYRDPLPPSAVARLGTVRLKHGGGVESLAFSPEGKVLLSAGEDNTVSLWDVATGRELITLVGTRAVFSPHGKMIATDGEAGTGGVWHGPKGEVYREVEGPAEENVVRLWDVATGGELVRIRGARTPFAFSPDGRLIAAESDYVGIVRIWDLEKGTERQTLQGPSKCTSSIAFSPDGAQLASVYWDEKETVRVWDVATGRERLTLGDESRRRSVAFSPDGGALASGDSGHVVRLWEAASGETLFDLRGHEYPVLIVTFSSDGRTLASGDARRIRLWDVETGEEKHVLPCGVDCLAFSPDGRTLVSGGGSGVIRFWDVATGTRVIKHDTQERWIWDVAFSPDGRRIATASSSYDAIRLWDPLTGDSVLRIGWPGLRVHSLDFSPDGKMLASGDADGKVSLWDAATGDIVFDLTIGDEPVESVAFSPDGKTLVSAYEKGTVRLWDVAAGVERLSIDDAGYAATFSPDGKTLATRSIPKRGRRRHVFHLWDAETGEKLRDIQGPWHGVHGHFFGGPSMFFTVFSPDARTLATSGHDDTVRIWEVSTGKELLELKGHEDSVFPVAFSPDGKLVASGGKDNTVRLWDATTGSALAVLRGHARYVVALDFSPDGKLLASVSIDTTALVWDVRSAIEKRIASQAAAQDTESRAAIRPTARAVREVPIGEDPTWMYEWPLVLRRRIRFSGAQRRLGDALALIEEKTRLRAILDPEFQGRSGYSNLEGKEMTLRPALERITSRGRLHYLLKEGEVFVSTPEGTAKELRRQIAEGKRPNWRDEIRQKLQYTSSYEAHVDRPIKRLIQNLERLTGVKMELDPRVAETNLVIPAGFKVGEMSQEQVLKRILEHVGLDYVLRQGVIFISAPENLREKRDRGDASIGPPSTAEEPVRVPQKVMDIDDIELARNIWAVEKAYASQGPARLRELRRYLDYPHPLVRMIAARKLALLRDKGALPKIRELEASRHERHLTIAKLVVESSGRSAAGVTRLAEILLHPEGYNELVSIWCELGWSSHLEEFDFLRKPNWQGHLPFIPAYGDILLRREFERVPEPEREDWLFEKLVRFDAVWEYEAAMRAIVKIGRPAVPRTLRYLRELISAPAEGFTRTSKWGSMRETCLSIGCNLLMSLPTDERSVAFLEGEKAHFTHRWTKPCRERALRWLKAGVQYPYRYNRLLHLGHEHWTLTVQDNARTLAWYGKRGPTEAPVTDSAVPSPHRPLPAVPPGYRSLTDLGRLTENNRIPARKRARELAAWLRHEVKNPRPTTTGAGGGPISSGYVCLQVAKGLGFVANPNRVEISLAGKPLPDPGEWFRAALGLAEETDLRVRDWLTAALGMAGDSRVVHKLIEILRDRQEGYLRAAAAEALGDLRAKEAVPELEAALADPFSVKAVNCVRGVHTSYPVREAARGSLARIRRRQVPP